MEFIAYNYFKTPHEAELISIAKIINLSLQISHAGKNDPPKKFSGHRKDICNIIKQKTNATNYTFLRDLANGIEMTIAIHNDSSWSHSTISISGKSKEKIEAICIKLNKALISFICISGVMNLGSTQAWSILYQSNDCPPDLLALIENA